MLCLDCGYESSPAPSLDVSFDIYSDDSVKDPSYSPSHCPSESSSDKRNSYTNSPVSSPDNVTNIEYLNAPCSVDIGKVLIFFFIHNSTEFHEYHTNYFPEC